MPPNDRIVPDARRPPPPATAEPPTAMQTCTAEDAVRLLCSPLHRTVRALAGTRLHRRYRPPAMAALAPTSYDPADHAAAPTRLATNWGVPRRPRSWRDRVHDKCAGALAEPAAPTPRCPPRRPSPTATLATALIAPASAAAAASSSGRAFALPSSSSSPSMPLTSSIPPRSIRRNVALSSEFS